MKKIVLTLLFTLILFGAFYFYVGEDEQEVGAFCEFVDFGAPQEMRGGSFANFDGKNAQVFGKAKKHTQTIRMPLEPASKYEIIVQTYGLQSGSANIEVASKAAAFWDRWCYGKSFSFKAENFSKSQTPQWREHKFIVSVDVFKDAKTYTDPLQLVKFNIEFNSPEALAVGKVLVRRVGIFASLCTGNPKGLAVVNAFDKKQEPSLNVSLVGEDRAEAKFSYKVSDIYGNKIIENSKILKLRNGQTKKIKLPYPEVFGLYKADWVIEQNGQKFDFSRTYAFMNSTQKSKRKLFADGFLFSVCTHLERYTTTLSTKMIDYCEEAGFNHIRTSTAWDETISPKRDVFIMAKSDFLLDKILAAGMERQEWVLSSPLWLRREMRKLSEKDAQALWKREFAKWIEFFVSRSKGKVRMFENINEVNLQRDKWTPEKYAKYQAFTYKHLKKANPDALLLSGSWGGISQSMPWQKEVYTLEPETYDVVAMHHHCPYETDVSLMPKQVALFKQLKVKKWFSNETAMSGVEDLPLCNHLYRKLIYDWSLGSIGYTWYNLRGSGYDPKNGEHNFGLLHEHLNPRAMYITYNMINGLFADAHFVREMNVRPDTYVYRFEDAKQAIFPIWNMDSNVKTRHLIFKTNAKSVKHIDIFGNTKNLNILDGQFVVVPSSKLASAVSLTPANASFEYVGSLIDPNKKITMLDKQQNVDFEIFNPCSKNKNVKISITPPAGAKWLNSENTKIEIASNSKAKYQAQLQIENSLRDSNDAKELGVNVEIDGNVYTSIYNMNKALRVPKTKDGEKRKSLAIRANSREKVMNLLVAHPDNQYLFWNGEPDLAIYAFMYYPRGRKFFMQLHIIDDVHRQNNKDAKMYFGDSVQLMLLMPSQKSPWNIGFALNESGEKQVYIWESPDGVDVAKTLSVLKKDFIVSRDEKRKKTVYNVVLDLPTLGVDREVLLKNGFKVNILANDNDGNVRESHISLIDGEPREIEKWENVDFEE